MDNRQQLLRAAKRLLAAKEAKDDLLTYMRLQMPDPEDVDDVEKSRYQITPLARVLADIVQQVEKRQLKRVCVSVGPQMGKSDVLSRNAPSWLGGRDPYAHMILASYNQDFANDFGNDVKRIVEGQAHQLVFPDYALQQSAADMLVTRQGGKMAFVGIGGSGSGKPADYFFVDDPYRNDEDAQSPAYREKVWKWFNGVAMARARKNTAIIVVHTRWHTDDLIGRLCDPDHPERNKAYAGLADRWTYINLPAVVTEPKLAKALGVTLKQQDDPIIIRAFGDKPMAALWEDQKPLELLAEAKEADNRIFGALYLGKPTPDDGEYFKSADLMEYGPGELPENLRKYGASDHAVSTKQTADYTVAGCVGVDDADNLWVLPDIVWDRISTDETVEAMLDQFRRHRPLWWRMENEMISKSFGPFLRKRMREESVYLTILPVTPSKDKMTRARAIQGRMQARKVYFPRHAPWWPEARAQLLRFPFGSNDDFVDWLAHIGGGLAEQWAPEKPKAMDDNVIPIGSIKWILRRSRTEALKQKQDKARAGW